MIILRPFRAITRRLLTPLAVALLLGPAIGQAAGPAPSHDEFWRAGLASRPSLNLEHVGTLTFDGVTIERLRYSGSVWDGEPQRVYALYAHPAGPGPFPAILQIHGAGQTCYPANVAYFVKHGYACLAFDWTGPGKGRDDDSVTHWAKAIKGNLYGSDGEDFRRSVIFHTTCAAISGIDVVAARSEVDANRIGIEGVSWGGFFCWCVNGLDPRVKAAVPVYGLGDLDRQWNEMGSTLGARTADWRAGYRRLLDAASFTATQHGAILFVDGADDFFGPQDLAEARLDQLAVDHRRSYGPNRMHNVDEGSALAAVGWLDAHLKPGAAPFPAEPRVDFSTGADGQFTVTVTPDPAQAVRAVRIDFARGGQLPLLRCWLSQDAAKTAEGKWSAAVPLVDATDPIAITAQVIDERGMLLSSAVRSLRPAVEVRPRPMATGSQSDVISDWGAQLGGWYSRTGVDLYNADPPPGRLRSGEIDGHRALLYDPVRPAKSVDLATRLTVDPAVAKGNGRRLELWVHDVRKVTVRTNYILREPAANEYEGSAPGGAGWHRLVLAPSDFKAYTEGKGKGVSGVQPPFASWNQVHEIALFCDPVGGGKLAVGRVAWVP